MSTFANRVIELRMMHGHDLVPDPRNWRTHPPAQKSTLARALERIGFVGAIVARVADNGDIVIVDGHLRASYGGAVPVLVTDLTEDEAAEVIATHDTVGAMATADEAALLELVEACDIHTEYPDLDLPVNFADFAMPDMTTTPDFDDEPSVAPVDHKKGNLRRCPACGHEY